MLPNTIAEATRLMGIPEQFDNIDDGLWAVAMNEQDAVVLREAAPFGKVFLECPVAEVPARNYEKLCTMMLAFNYLGPELDGLRFAYTGPGSPAVLVADLPTDCLEPGQLAGLMDALLEKAVAWRQVFTASESHNLDVAMDGPEVAPHLRIEV